MDLVNFLATIKRMKLLTDVLMTNNQRFLERYTQYHLIEAPNDRDLEYMNEIPPEKSKSTPDLIMENEYNTNIKIQELMTECSKMDKKIITQISCDIIEEESLEYKCPSDNGLKLDKRQCLKVSYSFFLEGTFWF